MEDRKLANLSNRTVATASGTDADDELGRVGEGDNAILPAFKIWTSPVRLRFSPAKSQGVLVPTCSWGAPDG